ncbi:hypothetical protein WCE34_00485 [Luteimonas sp. MJ204]|uniref:hypothetical protein n=1 Tax=Luteimonas sp. MJ145 TaxID=3129234 RepID=UPI0031BA2D86
MHQMIELHPPADALTGLGLPSIPYPVALPAFQAAVANDGELPLADMLHGLQLRAAREAADWQAMEPAMARLAELLAPDDADECLAAEGADWWIEIGPVDLGGAVVALQRDDALLAAITQRPDGRLRMAAYRPLDGRSIELLVGLARGGVALADLRLPAAAESGLPGLSRWSADAGSGPDADTQPPWRTQPALAARRPAFVLAEIGSWELLRV